MVKIKDLRAMSVDELEARLVECKKEQLTLRDFIKIRPPKFRGTVCYIVS